MSRLEDTRVTMGHDLAPFNQRMTKDIAETHKRLDGDTQSKGYKAEQRKIRQEEFIEKTLPRMQLERGLGHILDGTATPEDVGYFFRHADKLGPTAITGEAAIQNSPHNEKI